MNFEVFTPIKLLWIRGPLLWHKAPEYTKAEIQYDNKYSQANLKILQKSTLNRT